MANREQPGLVLISHHQRILIGVNKVKLQSGQIDIHHSLGYAPVQEMHAAFQKFRIHEYHIVRKYVIDISTYDCFSITPFLNLCS